MTDIQLLILLTSPLWLAALIVGSMWAYIRVTGWGSNLIPIPDDDEGA